MMLRCTSKIGGDEKWLNFLYITLLDPMPFANDLDIVNNNNLDSERKKRISDDPSHFGPSICKEKIAIIGNGKNEGGTCLNVLSGIWFWRHKVEVPVGHSGGDRRKAVVYVSLVQRKGSKSKN